jgi:hypothetical protein
VPLYVHFLAGGVTPDNTPHGYNLTFAFPMILFIVIGGILYLVLFQFPHNRVPPRRLRLSAGTTAASAASPAAGSGSPGTNGSGTNGKDDAATPGAEAGA